MIAKGLFRKTDIRESLLQQRYHHPVLGLLEDTISWTQTHDKAMTRLSTFKPSIFKTKITQKAGQAFYNFVQKTISSVPKAMRSFWIQRTIWIRDGGRCSRAIPEVQSMAKK